MNAKKKTLLDELVEEIPPAEKRLYDKCSDVGDQIYELLEARNMTQRDLACKMGKSESYVSRILAGGVNMTLRTIAEIEAAFDADILVTPMYSHEAREEPARELEAHDEDA